MKDLPTFRHVYFDYAESFAKQVFGNQFTALHTLDDHAFRALFDPGYFMLQDDRTEPSKSQWNTLKKRMKRINDDVFVFKEHGETTYETTPVYYVDFGFFLTARDNS